MSDDLMRVLRRREEEGLTDTYTRMWRRRRKPATWSKGLTGNEGN